MFKFVLLLIFFFCLLELSQTKQEVSEVRSKDEVWLPPSIKPWNKTERNYYYNLDGPTKHIILHCEAKGEPTPKITWEADGEPISSDKIFKNGTYIMTITDVQHEGFYQCFAENDYGMAVSEKIEVKRAKIPLGLGGPIPVFGKNGGYLKLSAQVDAKSCVPQDKCSIWWESSGQNIVEDDRVVIDEEGNLHFSHLTDEENNLLVSSVTHNSMMQTQTEHSSHIIKFEGGEEGERRPEIKYATKSKVVLEGKDLHLQCIFSARPAIHEVEWKRDGEPLFRYKRIEITNHTLKIQNLKQSEGGTYTCEGRNRLGRSIPHEIVIRVESVPQFTSNRKPQNTNKTTGEEVIFNCDATGRPTVDIKWSINWKPVEEHRLYSHTISLTADQKMLRVVNLHKENPYDLMVVQCNASNTHGYAFANGYINVLGKAHLTIVPEDVSTLLGNEVIFNCQGNTDASKDLNVMWFHNNQVIEFDTERQLLKNNSLQISSVKSEHEGVYRCELNDGLSQASGEAELKIILIAVSTLILWILLVLLVLFLIFALILCVICKRRNQEIKYKVGLNETKYGLDPYYDIKSSGFKEFQRPEGDKPSKGSRASLTKSLSLASEDSGSLDEYGILKPEKFAEDGSFIGQYNPYTLPKSSFV